MKLVLSGLAILVAMTWVMNPGGDGELSGSPCVLNCPLEPVFHQRESFPGNPFFELQTAEVYFHLERGRIATANAALMEVFNGRSVDDVRAFLLLPEMARLQLELGDVRSAEFLTDAAELALMATLGQGKCYGRADGVRFGNYELGEYTYGPSSFASIIVCQPAFREYPEREPNAEERLFIRKLEAVRLLLEEVTPPAAI